MRKVFVSSWDTEPEAREEQNAQAAALVAMRQTKRYGVTVERVSGRWNVYLIDREG